MFLKSCVFFDNLKEFNKNIEEKIISDDLNASTILAELKLNNVISREGDDKYLREPYVHTQDVIERYLTLLVKNNKIKNIRGFIHTPFAPTPLCKLPVGRIDTNIVSQDFDYERAITVIERSIYLRDYLKYGGILYAVYPTNGLSERTEEQQEIFNNEVQKNSKNLFIIELEIKISEFPRDMCGATYFFTLEDEIKMVFSIKSYQANDTEGKREWSLWLGTFDNQDIQARTGSILNFINNNSRDRKLTVQEIYN